LNVEKIILKELGYELFRIVDHPQKYMPSYYKLLKIKTTENIAQKA